MGEHGNSTILSSLFFLFPINSSLICMQLILLGAAARLFGVGGAPFRCNVIDDPVKKTNCLQC